MKQHIGIFLGFAAAMILVAMTVGGHSSRADMPDTVKTVMSFPSTSP